VHERGQLPPAGHRLLQVLLLVTAARPTHGAPLPVQGSAESLPQHGSRALAHHQARQRRSLMDG